MGVFLLKIIFLFQFSISFISAFLQVEKTFFISASHIKQELQITLMKIN